MRKCEKVVIGREFKAPAYANFLRQGFGGQEASEKAKQR